MQVAGVGGIPSSGVAAVSVAVIAQNTAGGRLRAAPNGDASAGEISWDAAFPNAAGSFTVPLNTDGTISIETEGSTQVTLSVSGYWKMPSSTDTGLGLHILDAPERLVDTTAGTGICDGSPCGRITVADTTVEIAGHGGVPADAAAVMVAVNVIDPGGPGLVGVGAAVGESSGAFVFGTGVDTQASFITALSDSGTVNVNTWAVTDLSIDVIGYFTAPTRTYRYSYDTAGLRSAKTLDDEGVAGAGWRKEYTWDPSGGLPLLLAEHRGTQASYLVYGPQGTPIYQVTATGDVMYFHQDQLGSTRLVTNANGTTKGTLTYSAYGKVKTNTVPWLQEQPLLGYNSQYHDTETGYIYLRARHYDPATGQFTSVDPLFSVTGEPYGYTRGNPVNRSDPSGLWAWDGYCVMGVNCDERATYAVASPQDAANFSGGVINGLTLGHGAGITEALPFTQGKVNYDSGWVTAGTVTGTVPWVVGSVGGKPAWTGASTATTGISITARATAVSAVINGWNACHAAGWTSDCSWALITNSGTAALGVHASLLSSPVASLFSVLANYLDPDEVRNYLSRPASAAEPC